MVILAVFPLYFSAALDALEYPVSFRKGQPLRTPEHAVQQGKHAPVPIANADQGKIVSIVSRTIESQRCKPD
jgi:hypothetical protein